MSGLSNRMIAVANMVTPGKCIADIGCDHAYTSIYLIENGLAEMVIAMDIGAGPLDIARKNIMAAGLSDKIETRLSDGFAGILPSETDGAIIAGMGGGLIISILDKGRSEFTPGYELVLSPQSDISLVRRYLRKNQYIIKQEIMMEDQKKLYNIMRVVFDGDISKSAESADKIYNEKGDSEEIFSLEDVYDEYGEYLLKHPTELFMNYLKKDIEKKKALVEKLEGCEGDKASERLGVIKRELDMAEKAEEIVMGGEKWQRTR
jgi:Predicted SAM-dependent methyltransferase